MKNNLKIVCSVICGIANSIILDVILLGLLTVSPNLLQWAANINKNTVGITMTIIFFVMAVIGGYIGYRISVKNIRNNSKSTLMYLNYIFGVLVIVLFIFCLYLNHVDPEMFAN